MTKLLPNTTSATLSAIIITTPIFASHGYSVQNDVQKFILLSAHFTPLGLPHIYFQVTFAHAPPPLRRSNVYYRGRAFFEASVISPIETITLCCRDFLRQDSDIYSDHQLAMTSKFIHEKQICCANNSTIHRFRSFFHYRRSPCYKKSFFALPLICALAHRVFIRNTIERICITLLRKEQIIKSLSASPHSALQLAVHLENTSPASLRP